MDAMERNDVWHFLFILIFLANTIDSTLIYRTSRMSRAANLPDEQKKTPDFIEKNGYIAETHEVTSEDGYISSIHRIPEGKSRGKNKNFRKGQTSRPIVFVQHGLSSSSDNWVLVGPRSFPFVLADEGFDVWLGNARGNIYAQKHVNLTIDNPDFWEFSFHEQAIYDLAGSIDYALRVTGQKKVYLIGHSKGTTSSYVLLSMRPEYNDKVRLVVSFAPVAYVKHLKSSLIQSFFKHTTERQAKQVLENANVHAFPGLTDSSLTSRNRYCGQGAVTQPLCVRLLFLLFGEDYLMDKSIAHIYFSHYPDGGSIREFLHYLQLGKTDKFTPFDFGERENLKVYGMTEPPRYPLQKITAPVSFHYSDNDYIVSPEDLNRLIREIPNVAGVFRVPFDKFNHIDFMWGIKTDKLLYEPTIKLMRNY